MSDSLAPGSRSLPLDFGGGESAVCPPLHSALTCLDRPDGVRGVSALIGAENQSLPGLFPFCFDGDGMERRGIMPRSSQAELTSTLRLPRDRLLIRKPRYSFFEVRVLQHTLHRMNGDARLETVWIPAADTLLAFGR
jgi:hypothetical protein